MNEDKTKYTDLSDPYRLNPPPLRFHNDMLWVASDESGEVYVDDLPEDKRRALFARIDRDPPTDDCPL